MGEEIEELRKKLIDRMIKSGFLTEEESRKEVEGLSKKKIEFYIRTRFYTPNENYVRVQREIEARNKELMEKASKIDSEDLERANKMYPLNPEVVDPAQRLWSKEKNGFDR